MVADESQQRASLGWLILGFAIIYVVWGSTYLAIKFAIETLPPFLMAGGRFLSAGLVMYAVLIGRERVRPDLGSWRSAAVIGALMCLGGNGLVTWSEQWVPSGVAALVVSTIPLWMVLLEWKAPGGRRPTAAVMFGLVIGFAGVALLLDASTLEGGHDYVLPFAAILAAPLLWAIGTMRSRGAPRQSPLLASAMQMIVGGAMLIALGTVQGEWNEFHPASVSQRSLTAFIYLVVMGSIVAFSAYTWLIRVASPSAVSTYAYVNPLVAVLLGWAIGDEAISMNMLVATPLIVGAVATITLRRRPKMQLEREPELTATDTPAVISPARAE